MLVEQIMTEDFETVSRAETLDVVVEKMLKNDVDHVIVLEEGDPSAVITHKKALIASYKTGAPLAEIPVSGFGRGLDTTIQPKTTVLLSVGKIKKANADCLPVVADFDILGVLTKDNIIDNVSSISRDVLRSKNKRHDWTA